MHLYHHHYVFVFIYSHIHFTLFLCCSCSHTPSVFDCNAHHATSTSFIFISSISHYYTIPILTVLPAYSHYFVMDLKVAGLKKSWNHSLSMWTRKRCQIATKVNHATNSSTSKQCAAYKQTLHGVPFMLQVRRKVQKSGRGGDRINPMPLGFVYIPAKIWGRGAMPAPPGCDGPVLDSFDFN